MSDNLRIRVWTSVSRGALFFGLYWLLPSLFVCLLAAIAGYIVFVEWPRLRGGYQLLRFASLSDIYLLYPVLPLILLLVHVVRYCDAAPWYGLYPFIAAWLVDIAAYLVGSYVGRHHCCPQLSPKKTWEGIFGGVASLMILHMGVWLLGRFAYPCWFMALSALVVAVTAICGDLFISFFKRRQGIKDTGALLPGHGGLLDRFDSVLAVSLLVGFFELFYVRALSCT